MLWLVGHIMENRDDRMVWIDLEMTGLDISKEKIIEIATVITDGELNIIAEGPNLAVSVEETLSWKEWTNGTRDIIIEVVWSNVFATTLYLLKKPKDKPWNFLENM
jgi:oligoribonuclease